MESKNAHAQHTLAAGISYCKSRYVTVLSTLRDVLCAECRVHAERRWEIRNKKTHMAPTKSEATRRLADQAKVGVQRLDSTKTNNTELLSNMLAGHMCSACAFFDSIGRTISNHDSALVTSYDPPNHIQHIFPHMLIWIGEFRPGKRNIWVVM